MMTLFLAPAAAPPLALAATVGSGVIAMPGAAALLAAKHDDEELERLGVRLGSARLLRIASDGDGGRRAQRLLALKALGLSGERQAELAAEAIGGLIELLRRTEDARVQEGAGEALGRLCRGLAGGAALLSEEALVELRLQGRALLRLAGDQTLPVPVREQLLLAALRLPADFVPVELWLARAEDEAAPLRQAALWALALRPARPDAAGLPGFWQQRLDAPERGRALEAALVLCEAGSPLARGLSAERVASFPAGAERNHLNACLRRRR